MTVIFAWVSGLIFGIGLIVAGMANPAKVLGFLDLFGEWDPSLAFVMGGGLLITTSTYWLVIRRRTQSVLGQPCRLPTETVVTPRLIAGSLIFGVGWGLAGICPGPAVALFGTMAQEGLIFMASMLGGMLLYRVIASRCPCLSGGAACSLKK